MIFYPDENAGEDQAVYVPVEPADPFTEAIRTGLEIGAEIVFADPDAGQRPHLKDAYPDTVCDPPHRPRPLYRGLPRLSAAALRGDRAPRRGHRLETAGRRSARQCAGGGLAQPARPGAGRHGGAAGAAPGAHPPRRHRAAQSASRLAGRDSARISGPAVALREFPRPDDRCQPDRPPPRAARRFPRGREGVRGEHRRADRALAAAPAGALHAQSRAGRRTISRPASSI